MNLPQVISYEEQAIDSMVSVINRAKEILGQRQTLRGLANTRKLLTPETKVTLTTLHLPLAITTEAFIRDVIDNVWKLSDTFMYTLKYLNRTQDECSQYFYFEAIFSQPTAEYPIPQATVSVFFRVEDKYLYHVEDRGVPSMVFRIEGQRTDHDIRYVKLNPDWILGVLQMKIKFFKRIEEIGLF
ncbi:unnamed protein product [Diatraea saccharalis]|uniref:Uncharacterized protein n=1 Tax=Diatraea saccharalis TaxID=40085 RepID=A0A9N9RGW0_9NEOP|nr:unnamed protein product [Diatraea saccharalis]